MSGAEIAGKLVASSVIKKLRELLPNEQAKLDAEYDRQTEEMALEASAAVQELAKRVDGITIENFVQKATQPENENLVRTLVRAGLNATHDDRRRLLGAALAGSLTIDFSTEMRSRIARAVIALEPSDVALLRRIANGSGERDPEVLGLFAERSGAAMISLAQLAATLLVSVKTYDERPVADPEASVYAVRASRLGVDLLRAIEAWNGA